MNVWMYWDCPQCGTRKIRGDKRTCPGCGRARGDGVKFYIPENEAPEEVSKEQENNQPDWYCEYCSSLNNAHNTACEGCGSPRSESIKDYFDISSPAKHSNYAGDTEYNFDEHIEDAAYNPSSSNSSEDTPIKTSSKGNTVVEWIRGHKEPITIASAIAAIVALTISLIVFLFVPYKKNIEVEMFSWERSIAIEELKTFNESGWSLPSEARLQRTSLEVRTYEDVLDHYETKTRQVAKQRQNGYDESVTYVDLGNGQAEKRVTRTPRYETYYETETYEEPVYRKEPVYDTKYYYEIDRWTETRTVNTAGAGTLHDPYWGEVILGDKEREGQRTESYYVHAKDGETYSVELQDWEKLEPGSFITVSVRRIDNKIVDIDFSE